MSFSNFKKLKTVIEKYGLDSFRQPLFTDVAPIQPSAWLTETLAMAFIMPLTTEKSKSERVVSPILMEIAQYYAKSITLFSGEEFSIDGYKELAGPCDFFIALHPPKDYIEAPIITLTEAKNENMEHGIAQCAAQMYAAHLFNTQHGKDIKTIFGCTTTGEEWQFLKLENNVFYIDIKPLNALPTVLGVWHSIIQSYL